MEIIHRKISEGKKVLLIAPAQVRDTVWETKLNDAQINVKKIGMEQLGRKGFDVYECKKYDFIIIDESQNFRSKDTGRRENLMKIISLGNKRKQILLMSATPINNSLMDLYYQISIITGGRDDQFANIGIPDLFRYLDKASKHKLNDGLEKIQTLLNDIMIRRTRTFIKDVYPDERLGGQNITFPKRDYKEIRYGMTDIFGNIYQDLLDTISSLHMTPYGIERYNTTLTDEEKRRHTVLAKLQVILLLKRFESSINAVIISIDRKIKLFEYFGKMLEKNRIVSPKQLNKIMLKWNAQNMEGDEDQDEFFMEEIKKLPVQSTTAYDIKTMKRHTKSDLNHLYRYKKSLSQMPKFDKKAEAVADMILKDRALEQEGKKVLVFTEYTATAKYIKDFLEDKFDDKRVDIITGDTKEKARRNIIRQFSPKANLGDDEKISSDEIDILVSTEVLSEGQNLQDCNYIVNYDLPWNPMRIVQRIGRVDRLTSTHNTIHSRECFPDDKLDEILKLVGKLMDKIQDINDAIGLDAALLGREALPKNFSGVTIDRIRAFASGDTGSILDGMERESDLMPILSPINEINRHIRQMGITQMREFSMGRRSGKSGEGPKAILAYVQEKPVRRFYSVIYDYPTQEAKVVDDMEAITLIRCTKDDETYLPMDHTTHAESFRQLLHMDSVAQKAISRQNSVDYRIANELRSKPKKNEKIIEKIRDIIDDETDHGNLSEEGADEIDKMLDYPDLLHWSDDLESYIEQYQNNNNIKSLVNQLKKIGHNIGVKTNDSKIHTSGPKVLIGAMFVS